MKIILILICSFFLYKIVERKYRKWKRIQNRDNPLMYIYLEEWYVKNGAKVKKGEKVACINFHQISDSILIELFPRALRVNKDGIIELKVNRGKLRIPFDYSEAEGPSFDLDDVYIIKEE